jgi:hypothetical protein
MSVAKERKRAVGRFRLTRVPDHIEILRRGKTYAVFHNNGDHWRLELHRAGGGDARDFHTLSSVLRWIEDQHAGHTGEWAVDFHHDKEGT